jgi:hypothetical protein
MSQRKEQRCPTCDGRKLVPLDRTGRLCLQRGLAPGTCGDWLECPDCGGTGTFRCYEQRITPPRHIAVHGLKLETR